MPFERDALVRHAMFGTGRVRMDDGETVVVRFDGGLEECLAADLKPLRGLEQQLADGQFDPALPVVARALALCIRSVNDSWGVFAGSRISLLPHQLWVCKRVLETWPTRWLVADDVGLGKTIEAGLILTSLFSGNRIRRLLILAPASLVGQWQVRLREMFDIRLSIYAPAVDGEKADFWNTQDRVVASAHTLRLDSNGRWDRLLEAEPWDLVLVDEAHHMNAAEDGARTLALQLAEKMQQRGRIESLILFTGTPHRGKDYGFLSLLALLRPDDFSPRAPLEEQVHKLRSVMIRNNKQRVTDMAGNKLFTPVRQRMETYSYSPEEAAFYDKVTNFIASGKAYAAGMNQKDRRTVILVLITMQKLASSSVAAVRRALRNRLEKLRGAASRMARFAPEIARLQELAEEDDGANGDEIAAIEERLLENLSDVLHLNPAEIPALEELLEAADKVVEETKIERILEVIDEHFEGRSVLLFTEYKATQARVMGALQRRYGDGCATFINGDGFLPRVPDSRGVRRDQRMDRQVAAACFNRGEVRFLVSTEAAGEGIDLQEHCSALIHVDLPWNPMRLHQRVGRVSRYGQTETVDVVTLRNPDTVESRIWSCLDEKLDRITLAFQGGMDDPEDMRQLILGMASPRMFSEVFAEAPAGLKGERLERWFDQKTSTFGGRDAVDAVKAMFGNVSRFDFGEVEGRIPKVDLPDLVPFMKALLAHLGKRATEVEPLKLEFQTPRPWTNRDFRVVDRYRLVFDRRGRVGDGEDLAGAGLLVVDAAIDAGHRLPQALGAVEGLDGPLFLFAVQDRVTGSEGAVRRVVVGVRQDERGWTVVPDWQVIKMLGPVADKPRGRAMATSEDGVQLKMADLEAAASALALALPDLDLPFNLPEVLPLLGLASPRVVDGVPAMDP